MLAHSAVLNKRVFVQRVKNNFKISLGTGFHSPLRTQFPGDLNPAGGLCATRFSFIDAQGVFSALLRFGV